MVNPIVKAGKEVKARQLPFFTCWFDLLFVFGVDVEHRPRHDLASKTDPDNLTLEKMAFFAFEMRVRADRLFQITRKDVLDSSGCIELVRGDNGQFFPVAGQQISGNPVGGPVDSGAFGLNFRRQLAFLPSFSCRLDDVVIFLFA